MVLKKDKIVIIKDNIKYKNIDKYKLFIIGKYKRRNAIYFKDIDELIRFIGSDINYYDIYTEGLNSYELNKLINIYSYN